MRRPLGRLVARACLIWIALSTPALAACAGQDLIDRYRAENPTGIAQMFATAHAVPNAQGILWQVDAPDGDEQGVAPSFLFGTHHSGEAVATVPDRVWQLLDTATAAIFEIDLRQRMALEMRLQTDPTMTMDPAAAPLAERLPAGSRDAVEIALRARGVPFQAATQMRPWFLMTLLGFPRCHLLAAGQGAEPLDHVMADRAGAAGIPVVGLETFDQSIDALRAVPHDIMWQEIAMAAEMDGLSEDIYRTHLSLYADGEVQAVLAFSVWLAEQTMPGRDHLTRMDAVMSKLLDRRNRAWVPQILPYLEKGGAMVIAGALHLPGDAGLVELLRAEGYTVTRVQ